MFVESCTVGGGVLSHFAPISSKLFACHRMSWQRIIFNSFHLSQKVCVTVMRNISVTVHWPVLLYQEKKNTSWRWFLLPGNWRHDTSPIWKMGVVHMRNSFLWHKTISFFIFLFFYNATFTQASVQMQMDVSRGWRWLNSVHPSRTVNAFHFLLFWPFPPQKTGDGSRYFQRLFTLHLLVFLLWCCT